MVKISPDHGARSRLSATPSSALAHTVIKIAQSPEQLDAVFKARYRVLAEQEGYFHANLDRRLYDRFDLYHLSVNFMAVFGGEVVGGLRLTDYSPVGSSCEDMYHFQPHFDASEGAYGTGAWFFLDRAHRGNNRIAHGVLTLGYAWAMERGWRKLFSVVNPPIAPTLANTGYQPLAEERVDPRKGLPFVPMVLEFSALSSASRSLISRIIRAGVVTERSICFQLRAGPSGDASPRAELAGGRDHYPPISAGAQPRYS